ncbi:MAG: hypothetical protein O6829_01625 [Alphaproteobacteria bacterium]|nr:hypothetical protein [Alphaproteobacteria bacterium]
MSPLQITAEWQGPIFIGNLPVGGEFKKLKKPGVYIYTQEYPKKLVAYAGHGKNILWRIQQHYSGFLGFIYWPRDSKGNHLEWANKQFMYLNNIDKNLRLLKDEAKRLKFFYCILEQDNGSLVRPVESVLIRILKDKADQDERVIRKKFECDNSRREGYREDYPRIILINNFSKGQGILKKLLGSEPIRGG